MLTSQGDELVLLGALGNLDAVLVEELLELAIGPRAEKGLSQAVLSTGSRRGGRGTGIGSLDAGKTRVAADGCENLVARGRLRNWDAALVQEGFELRFGPGGVEPVTWVGSRLADLAGSRVVVFTGGLEESVALARLGNGDTMLVAERLQLRIGPARDRVSPYIG